MSRPQLAFRRFAHAFLQLVLSLLTKFEIHGRANIPPHGPLIVVFNHLAHADAFVMIAAMPYPVEPVGLVDLLSVPVTGQVLRAYGIIPVHRDQVDRRVIQHALTVLQTGGVLLLAPEARRSVTGALERARAGAAYLAMRSGTPVLPVAITGTEKILDDLKRLRRPHLTATFGTPFTLSQHEESSRPRRERRREAADEIMIRIARMLPPEYRGVYRERV
ncbi:MAG: lysophospholipid acyltransferase family protein [Anaerolineae bacterium]